MFKKRVRRGRRWPQPEQKKVVYRCNGSYINIHNSKIMLSYGRKKVYFRLFVTATSKMCWESWNSAFLKQKRLCNWSKIVCGDKGILAWETMQVEVQHQTLILSFSNCHCFKEPYRSNNCIHFWRCLDFPRCHWVTNNNVVKLSV